MSDDNTKWKGSTGIIRPVFNSKNARAVRNEGGLICTVTKPSKYSGQDERFEQDMEIAKANQELIVDTFQTVQKCNLIPSIVLEQRDQLIRLSEEVLWNGLNFVAQRKLKELIKEIKSNG